ncbi:MAG: hypothetical protein ACT6FF_08940 [Methanosarcinaceae archaeon]
MIPPTVSIGFIGAGSYAQSNLLPNIPRNKDVCLKGVMTASGASFRSVAERYGFVEKPLCFTEDELGQIAELMTGRKSNNLSSENTIQPIGDLINQPILMVGYNRRFAPLVQLLKEKVGRRSYVHAVSDKRGLYTS